MPSTARAWRRRRATWRAETPTRIPPPPRSRSDSFPPKDLTASGGTACRCRVFHGSHPHSYVRFYATVWKGGQQARRERAAAEETRDTAQRQGRPRWPCNEQETGDRDRFVGGSQEGR